MLCALSLKQRSKLLWGQASSLRTKMSCTDMYKWSFSSVRELKLGAGWAFSFNKVTSWIHCKESAELNLNAAQKYSLTFTPLVNSGILLHWTCVWLRLFMSQHWLFFFSLRLVALGWMALTWTLTQILRTAKRRCIQNRSQHWTMFCYLHIHCLQDKKKCS